VVLAVNAPRVAQLLILPTADGVVIETEEAIVRPRE